MAGKLVKKEEAQIIDIQSAIFAAVKDKDLDASKLEKMLELQAKMEDRQADKLMSEALATFQANCPIIPKTKKGHNSKFAPIDEIIFHIKPFLAESGLSYTFDVESVSDKISELITTIKHRSGGKFTSRYTFESLDDGGKMNNSQRRKSALSYAKRAGIESALGIITADEDDDAARAVNTSATESQLEEIKKLMTSTDTEEKKFLKFMKRETLDEFTSYDAKKAIHALKQKAGKK